MNKAVIMAGGFGTRLRPLTTSIPKPMVPLINVPMMEHIVNLLKSHDITDIVSLLYYQPDVIKNHFGTGDNFGITMQYREAAADYGTAGSVRNAADLLNDRFIIISGDVLTDFDISAALEFHKQKGSKATILLTRVPNPLQFGIVMTDTEGRITRFLEKPSWGEVFSDTINTGIYILDADVLDLIPYQRDFDFSKDLFPLMLRQNMPIYGYIAEGYWRDIGNLNEYQIACMDVLDSKVKITISGEEKDKCIVGQGVSISPSASFSGMVVLGNHTTVGDHASLRNCVIGNNVTIGAGARLSGVVLWDNVIIGEGASLTDDVICNDAVIGGDSTISENVFIAESCIIGREATLMPNIKLWPRKQVEAGAILSRSLVQEEKWLRELFTDARVTGLSNIEINPEFAAKLGSAIGNAVGANTTIVASRDADAASRMTHRALMSGLMSAGVTVNDLQVTSIPQTRQELRNGKAVAGLHVRRSIRQHDRTDIIVFNSDGRDLPSSKAKNIERFFFGEDIKRVPFDKVGDINFPERTNEAYRNRFLEALNSEAIVNKHFKILVDYSFGLASTIFPQILGKFQATVVSMNNYMDVSRPYSDTSTDEEAAESATVMRSLGYELGFKIDAGAEKIAIVDERGNWFSRQRLLTIITKLFLESNRDHEPYSIAIPVMASSEIDMIVKDYNVQIVRIKNTHSAMMDATQNKDIAFVGGTRGGFIFTDFLFASDGMFTVAKLMEMLALTGIRLSELDSRLPRRYQHQTSVDCPWESKGTVMRRAMEHSEGNERMLIDGVKIFKGGNSILLLPDREKAAFIIIAESDTNGSALELSEQYSKLVSEWAG
ncbi:MAG: NTP transferase domain-containing protein [Ignavibacteria bacterium]|nr:NTP transferase domain-containing protein [Ignavibacteria bacterium]